MLENMKSRDISHKDKSLITEVDKMGSDIHQARASSFLNFGKSKLVLPNTPAPQSKLMDFSYSPNNLNSQIKSGNNSGLNSGI